jgi:hypothetical protein
MSLSAMLCATSFVLAPIAGRSSAGAMLEQSGFTQEFHVPQLPPERPPKRAILVRDPFASPDEPGPAAAAPLQSPDGIVGMRVVQGQSTGIAVPFGGTTVRAIVTGGSARALIETNGRTQIVSSGDPLLGSTIVSIDSEGIRLSNGRRIHLSVSP